MMIYTTIRKSKAKLRPKKEREEYQAWLDKHKVDKKKIVNNTPFVYSLTTPAGRQTTNHIKSLNTGMIAATSAPRKVYTGDKVLGIATLHKSNAVPVFNNEEAVDISKMRR